MGDRLDIKICGGLLVDGTGASPIAADVGIQGDRIKVVGSLANADADIAIDASGLLVCPGFIDAHSHSDHLLLVEPAAPSKLFQGVTAEVIGNCGLSAAPISGQFPRPAPPDGVEPNVPFEWNSVAEFRALLQQAGPALNVVMLVGHANLRAAVIGYENRPAAPDEIARMTAILERGFDEGARGLSLGLIYPPGMFAQTDELAELAAAVARRGLICTAHMRNESARLLDAIDEMLSIARSAGARTQISHLKTSGRNNWPLIDSALARIRQARNAGLQVTADRYPYTVAHTSLDSIFPDWALAGGTKEEIKRLKTASDRRRLKEALARRPLGYWNSITVASTKHPANRRFQGLPLRCVADLLATDPVEAVLRLVETDETKTTAFFHGMCEENMFKILAEPWVMLGSDAGIRAPAGPLSRDFPHPRAYGTFSRMLRLALDGKTVPLAEAVRKMTSLPAATFGLKDRGVIAPGNRADVAMFDPREACDTADFSAPHSLARGTVHVIVNGVLTLRDGKFTGHRAGLVL